MGGKRQLAHTVYLEDPSKGGEQVGFGPGDDVPAWAAKLIGPHAYEDYDPNGDNAAEDDDEDAPPPQTGRGSGKGAWQDYAEREDIAAALAAAEVEIPGGASKEDIIAVLKDAGIRVE